MKKVFGLTLALVLSLTLLTGCGCSKKSNEKKNNPETKTEGPKANTNEGVIKDQTLDVFKFEKTSLIYEDGNSKLQTTVTNTSSETQYLKEFKIHVKDASGAEIIELTGFVGDNIEANKSKVISSVYGDDLTKATTIEYELVK